MKKKCIRISPPGGELLNGPSNGTNGSELRELEQIKHFRSLFLYLLPGQESYRRFSLGGREPQGGAWADLIG